MASVRSLGEVTATRRHRSIHTSDVSVRNKVPASLGAENRHTRPLTPRSHIGQAPIQESSIRPT